MGSSPPGFQPGQVVTVRYDPANPQDARLTGLTRLWFTPMLLGGMRIFILVLGIVLSLFATLL